MARLGLARLMVATIPFDRWSKRLGYARLQPLSEASQHEARQLAAQVEWAAKLLPFATKCLPRAMALSWMLRSRRIGHAVVFAVRPMALRDSDDQLHAWVEAGGQTVLGYLAGPWVETLRLGHIAMD